MPTDPAVNAARRLNAARKAALDMRANDPDLMKAMTREQRAFAALVEARPTTLRGACMKINEALGFLDGCDGAGNAILFARTAREALGGRDPQGWGIQALECAALLAAHHCGENGCPTVLLRTALEGLTAPRPLAVKLSSNVPLTPHLAPAPSRRLPAENSLTLRMRSSAPASRGYALAEERVS